MYVPSELQSQHFRLVHRHHEHPHSSQAYLWSYGWSWVFWAPVLLCFALHQARRQSVAAGDRRKFLPAEGYWVWPLARPGGALGVGADPHLGGLLVPPPYPTPPQSHSWWSSKLVQTLILADFSSPPPFKSHSSFKWRPPASGTMMRNENN